MIASKLPIIGPLIQQINDWLAGEPEAYISVALVVAGILLIFIGLTGDPVFKVTVLSWIALP